jgi:hypothetical protein
MSMFLVRERVPRLLGPFVQQESLGKVALLPKLD